MTAPARIPVAVFLTSFDAGGTERQMTELIRRLDRRRFDVLAACFHRRGVWLPRVAAVVSEVAEFPIPGFRSPRTLLEVAKFARWCRARRIAVLQAADIYANAFALPGAALAGVPVRVGSRREVHPSRGPGLGAAQRLGYAAAHRVVANSNAGAARLGREGVAAGRVAVIRNGLDLDLFARRPSRPRGHRLITVGRLRPEKAHEVLLAAVARLRAAWPSVTLRLVGDGVREDALRAVAAAHGLAGSVEFLGHREDVPALLRESDVFVLPSRIEAAPNAVLEAMAASLPVVASNVGGIPEAVTTGVNGVLVPPNDDAALADAVSGLFRDPAHADRLGIAARRHVETHYSFDRMVGAFETLYLSALASRGYVQAESLNPNRESLTCTP